MSKVERISISLDGDLCRKMDSMVTKRQYANRSEFVRDLVRKAIVDEAVSEETGSIDNQYENE